MFLLFKNGFKKLLKDYIQFGIYLVLITITVIFTSSFGIVTSNLISTNNQINKNYEKFDYSFRYTSSAYKSNDTQTFTPWFAFNIKLVEDSVGNAFPTLSFGENGVLKNYVFTENTGTTYSYESSYILETRDREYINFHFGDVESRLSSEITEKTYYPNDKQAVLNYTDDRKIEIVKSGEFGDLYRFNLENENFKKSLIGKIYDKYNFFNYATLSNQAKKAALNIYNFMFYLNNSALTNSIKKDLITIYKKNLSKSEVENYLTDTTIGTVDPNNDKYSFTLNPITDARWNTEEKNLFSNYASFYIKKLDKENIFYSELNRNGYVISDNKITQRNFFVTYFNMLGDLTNFKVRTTNEAVKWDSSGKKFRYISAFYNEKEFGSDNLLTHFYNEDIFTMYERTYNENSLTQNSFVVSSGFAKYNNYELGSSYNIFADEKTSYVMDGIGVDSSNVYPTIYEEDLLTNQENEAIYYISNATFNIKFNVEDQEKSYQDVSRTYLTYNLSDRTDLESDINLFQTYFADNLLNIKDVVTSIETNDYTENLSRAKIESYEETSLLNMRSSLFPGVIKWFLITAIVFCILFVLALSYVIYNIFKKVLVSQRSQIGNLKSLGFSNIKIISTYMLYMMLPVILLVPIGWVISVYAQTSLMIIFERYFNIPTIFSVDWKLLLIEWAAFTALVGFLIFMVSYFTVKQSPLILLQPGKSTKPNLFLSRIFSKIKFRNFTSKLRLVVISSAFKDLIIFFTILLFSSSVITVAFVTPRTMKNMTSEYYKNIKYNNDFSYSNVVVNNPLTRYSFYDMDENDKSTSNLNASIFNPYISTIDGYKDLFDSKYWATNPTSFRANFENVIYNNLLTFKGSTLSVGIMNDMIATAKLVDKLSPITVRNNFNNFACQVIPKLFGQTVIDDANDFESCIKSVSNNLLPSTVKALWDNDDNEFQNFSFNFSNISVDNNLDQMYTKLNSTIENTKQTNIATYGLDLTTGSKNLLISNADKIKYDDLLDYIPVLINKKDEVLGLKMGDEFNLKTPTQFLSTVNNNNELINIDYGDWSYKDQNLFSLDLSKFTYLSDKSNNLYFKDINGNYEQYYNMNDIELSIKKDSIDDALFNTVNKKYLEYSSNSFAFKDDGTNYILKPFDIFVYEDGEKIPLGLDSLSNGTNSWLNIAIEEGLLKNNLVDLTSYKKMKVVGVEQLYDGSKIYMDQIYANRLMGVTSDFEARKTFENGSSVNIWSNAKMSANEQNADQMQKILLSSFNANNTTAGFSKYMNQSIGYTDYVIMKKIAMANLITAVISIAAIFFILSLITATVIIYLITDMFIGRYKKFMNYMRIQGYSMREINSIILWIFLPTAVVAVLIGILLVWLGIGLVVPQLLLSIDIAVPMIIGWSVIPLVFLCGMAIFVLGYTVIMLSLKRVRLATLIGNE